MKRSVPTAAALALLLLAAALIALAACNGGGSAPSPTATEAAGPTGPTSSALPTATQAAIATAPFEGGRDPVEKRGGMGRSTPLLVRVLAMTQEFSDREAFDRLIIEFAGGLPGVRVEYVSPPITACGSGEPVAISGEAFLQVRMKPAAAHDESGTPTFDETELTPDLPTIVELKQTCDFEGEVTWVAGLSEEVDFNVFPLGEPFRNIILVDVAHP